MPLQASQPDSGSRLAPTADVQGYDPASPSSSQSHHLPGWGRAKKAATTRPSVSLPEKLYVWDSVRASWGGKGVGENPHCLPLMCAKGRQTEGERERGGGGVGGEHRPARSSIRPLIIHTEQLKTCHVSRNQTRFPQQSPARLRYVQKLSPAEGVKGGGGGGEGGGVDGETRRSLFFL